MKADSEVGLGGGDWLTVGLFFDRSVREDGRWVNRLTWWLGHRQA